MLVELCGVGGKRDGVGAAVWNAVPLFVGGLSSSDLLLKHSKKTKHAQGISGCRAVCVQTDGYSGNSKHCNACLTGFNDPLKHEISDTECYWPLMVTQSKTGGDFSQGSKYLESHCGADFFGTGHVIYNL